MSSTRAPAAASLPSGPASSPTVRCCPPRTRGPSPTRVHDQQITAPCARSFRPWRGESHVAVGIAPSPAANPTIALRMLGSCPVGCGPATVPARMSSVRLSSMAGACEGKSSGDFLNLAGGQTVRWAEVGGPQRPSPTQSASGACLDTCVLQLAGRPDVDPRPTPAGGRPRGPAVLALRSRSPRHPRWAATRCQCASPAWPRACGCRLKRTGSMGSRVPACR